MWTLLTAVLFSLQAGPSPVLTQGLSRDASDPEFLLECGTAGTRRVEDFGIEIRLDGREVARSAGVVGGVVGGLTGGPPAGLPAGPARIQLVLLQGLSGAGRLAGRYATQLLEGRLVPIERGRHRLAVRCLGKWSNEIAFEWEPSGEQVFLRPTLTLGVLRGAAWPMFVLDCPNAQPRRLPEATLLSEIALRLDGADLPPPSGGTIGSIPGTPGVDPVIEPRASVRLHLGLVQEPAGTSVSSRYFDARFTVGRIVPLSAGRHRIAARCLGQWSNEVTFDWEP